MVALGLTRSARQRLSIIGSAEGAEAANIEPRDEIDAALVAFGRYARETERRHLTATDELRQQSFLLDQMNDGLMRVAADGLVTYANVAASSLFGGRNPVGRSFIRVTRDHELHQAVQRCLSSGGDQQYTLEIAGEGRLVNAVITRVSVNPAEVLVTLRDVTEVVRLQHLRRDFVANVSHELRTPLSTIKILTETLMDLRPDDAEAVNYLSRIDGEVDAMTALVRDLLELSRLEAPGGALVMRSVNASQLVEDVKDRMAPQAERRGVLLVARVEPGAPSLEGDERRLHQALVNLVSNAIRHTPAGGRVEISVESTDGHVVFAVSDTGVGIQPDDLERVWERFFKVDRARSGSGTGLGLAIVKHIALAHGGSVAATSKLGAGSRFSIAIPRTGPHAKAGGTAEQAS